MNKLWKGKKGYRIAAAALILSIAGGITISHMFGSSADSKKDTAIDRLIAKRNEVHASIKMNELASENEEVRAIVTLKAKAVADNNDISEYTSLLKSKENKIIDNQESLIKKVEKITGNKVVNQSAYLVNSFSINATRKQIRKIAKLEGVDTVYEASLYKTCMNTAVKEGNVEAQWNNTDYGYTGEGVVVAVLDTGVNYKHQDMVLDNNVVNKYTKEEWKEKIKLLGYGEYFTEKVPFGYNYCSGKDDCLSSMEYHGYHVSGIISGNNDEINGVAKNAQILGIKVLDDQGGGTTDAIVKGIEDSVKLGADIINMSLGMDNAVVSDEDFMQVALDNAAKEGVICCIAAGNSGTSAADGDDSNKMNMEDTSIVGTPAVTESSLAVASIDNASYKKNLTVTAMVGKTEITFNALDQVGLGFNVENLKLIDTGIGIKENGKLTVSARKLKNNIAVVASGVNSANEKVYELSKAGVAGIIYVNKEDTLKEDISIYNWENIPVLIVDEVEGNLFISNNNSNFTTIDVVENGEVSNTLKMSYFTSWGPTNELGIKPEITAPGGNIKAAFDGTDKYAVLSGTSMATPFIAGSEAVMLNAVKARGLNLQGEELSKFLKNSLMNTADAVVDTKTGYYYSVRQQGSGLVDVYGAVDNNVIVTYNGEAKVELGEMTSGKDIDLVFTNYGKEDAVYTVDTTQLYTDFTVNDTNLEDEENTEEYGIKPVNNSVITFDKTTITVPAGGQTTVNARVAISAEFENNKYIEAFIKFAGKDVQDIGLPVLGFYGDFDAEPIIDKSLYEEGESFIASKVEGVKSTTSLCEYMGEGMISSPLGAVITKEKENIAVEANNNKNNNLTQKDKKNFLKLLEKEELEDEVKVNKKDAIPVKIGQKVDLDIVNPDSQVLYKVTTDYDMGCIVEIDTNLYPVINIYDKDMNLVNSNMFDYFIGGNSIMEINLSKKTSCYVEIYSLIGAVGRYDVNFKKESYNENADTNKLFENDEEVVEEEEEDVELILNKKHDIIVDADGDYSASYTSKEDGYLTLNFDTDKFISYEVYEMGMGSELSLFDFNAIAEGSSKGKFSKEIKVKKDAIYGIMVTSTSVMDESEKVGSLVIQKSDGANYYTLKTTYDGQRAAFSPNDDNSRDAVAPNVTQLRNAKEVKVTVLDKDKNMVRTIGSLYDLRKITYGAILYGATSDGFANYATGEYVNWDGKIYNPSTGNYEVAEDGQYYIQIEAKRAADVDPEITTMSVKVDTVIPEIKDVELTKEGTETTLTFTVKDNNYMSPYFYVDLCGEEYYETLDKTYAEAINVGEGRYSINLGTINDNDEVSLMVEDEAGNKAYEVLQESQMDEDSEDEDFEDVDFDDEDYDIDMEEDEEELYELCEGVMLDVDLRNEETLLGAADAYIGFSGTIEKGMKLTVNGNEADIYDDGEVSEFDVFMDVNTRLKNIDLNCVVTRDGVEVFNETFNVAIDVTEPRLTVLKSDVIAEMKSYYTAKETVVLLKDNIEFPISFQVKLEDDNVVEDSLEVSESTSDEAYIDLSEYFELSKFKKLDDEIDEEFDEEFDEEDEYESLVDAEYCGNNIYTITIKNMYEGLLLELNGRDAADNYGGGTMSIYTAQDEESYRHMCEVYSLDFGIEVENQLITKDQLNADGTYTIKGYVGEMPESLVANNKKIYVDPKTKEFTYDLPIKYGCNKVYFDIVLVNGNLIHTPVEFYMDDVNIKFNNLPKADKAGVINTTKEAFNLTGEITSYVNIAMINVNGDTLYLAPDMVTAPNGGILTKTFDYNIKLKKGKNIITIETITMAGTKEAKTLVVNYK